MSQPKYKYEPKMVDEIIIRAFAFEFPDDIDPEIGQQLEIQNEENEEMLVYISKVTDETVTLDANPPLAGKDLTFELELVSIA